MIYVGSILDGMFVKIGFAKSVAHVAQRIRALQTGCPFQIGLDFTIEGTQRQEEFIPYSIVFHLHASFDPLPAQRVGSWQAGIDAALPH